MDKKDLGKAIKYLINGQPWPSASFGPVELNLYYKFTLKDIITKKDLPYQENVSSMLVWLSKKMQYLNGFLVFFYCC